MRLSTRGLIVVIVLIAVWLGWLVNNAHTQRDAVAALRKAGALVAYNFELSELGVAHWPKWLVNQIGIDYFSAVYEVSLGVDGCDVDMVHLEHLTQLEELRLILCRVTDAGLRHLGFRLPSLALRVGRRCYTELNHARKTASFRHFLPRPFRAPVPALM